MSTRDPWEIASELARALEAAGIARASARAESNEL